MYIVIYIYIVIYANDMAVLNVLLRLNLIKLFKLLGESAPGLIHCPS